ncbi:hypothetical protein [Tunicatimonas pelagia]|uniref:hypothetical protein n=1 Tax=Tunicatimonas pelagia TaxID=931531 RepID=UPI002664F46D|nr:hypothetical protein [Tunicatimonas pelagia]WKN46155.1 hypothetical protein P0M28_14465 [Tunicatimonas pelagia]
MRTKLNQEEEITGFELKSIHNLPTTEVLNFDIPEEIILSILTDYPRADASQIISRIIFKLQNAAQSPADLNRYIRQLLVLSRLRKLDGEIEKQVKSMPITYDITKDRLYNRGVEQGIEQKTQAMITRLIRQGLLTDEQIAEVAEVTVAQIVQVRAKLYRK